MSPVEHRSNGLVQAAPAAAISSILSASSEEGSRGHINAPASSGPPSPAWTHLFLDWGAAHVTTLRRPLRQEIAQRATQQLPHSWLPARAADRRWLIQPRLWSERRRAPSSFQLRMTSPTAAVCSHTTHQRCVIWTSPHPVSSRYDVLGFFAKEELERPRWRYQSVSPEFLMINSWRTWEVYKKKIQFVTFSST